MFFKVRYKDKSYIYLYKKLAKIQIKNLNMFNYLIQETGDIVKVASNATNSFAATISIMEIT